MGPEINIRQNPANNYHPSIATHQHYYGGRRGLREQRQIKTYGVVPNQAAIVCGHDINATFSPQQRNCQTCWTTYFVADRDRTKALFEQLHKDGGDSIVAKHGVKLLKQLKLFVEVLKEVEKHQQTQPTEA